MRLAVVYVLSNRAVAGLDKKLEALDKAAGKKDRSEDVRSFAMGSLHFRGVFKDKELNVDPYRPNVVHIIVNDPPTLGMQLEADPRIIKDNVLEQNVAKIFVTARQLPLLRQFLGTWTLGVEQLGDLALPRLPISKGVPATEKIKVMVALDEDGKHYKAVLETLEGVDEVTFFYLFTLALRILHGLTLKQATTSEPLPLHFNLEPPPVPVPSEPGELTLNLTGLGWDGTPPTSLTGAWKGEGPTPTVKVLLLRPGADPATATEHTIPVVPPPPVLAAK